MKRFMTYITLVFLASLVFYGGTGVNLVSYCCSCCEKYGIEALMSARCCKMHHAHSSSNETGETKLLAKNCVNKHACALERINFKWISEDDQLLDIEPVEHDLFFAALFEYLDNLSFNTSFNEDHQITGPPIIACPRTYLSLLTTLLI